MLPFRGKAQSLSFLKGIGLLVPDYRVISHEELLSWGDPQIIQALRKNLTEKNKTLVPLQALAFAATIRIPEIIQLERMKRDWAIRSSASAEDSSTHSFAGIFRTELNIPDDLTPSVRAVWSSLYAPRTLEYCENLGLSWSTLTMDVILQQMVKGDKSGVLFQGPQILINTDSDLLVLEQDKIINSYLPGGSSLLNDRELDLLMGASTKIRREAGEDLDIEFIFQGNELFFLQARPITARPPIPVLSDRSAGIPCSPGMVTGLCVRGGESVQDRILVARTSAEALDFILSGAKGLILEEGALLSHVAILCRELGIPAIMAVPGATANLPGKKINLNGTSGHFQLL